MTVGEVTRDANDLVGKTLGQYKIIGVIGKGGMSTVYKAVQPSLERYIALKVLMPHFAEAEFVARFKREALAAARLSHPNVVHVYDAGEADGYYYIAMEYIEGGTLKDRLDERGHEPMDIATTNQVVQGIGGALEYAHHQGIVHRDVKPANIMFTQDGRVVLSDLGLAKFYEAADLTQMTAVIGTPYYMSPEQARSKSVDARSDIYSFGVVIYEMLTGHVPFETDTPWMAIHQHIYEAPPPIRQRNPVVPEALAKVVELALEKDPDQRYQHAADLARAFAEAQKPAPSAAVPMAQQAGPGSPAPVAAPEKRKRRWPLAWIGAVLGTVVIAALVIWGLDFASGSGGLDRGGTITATASLARSAAASPSATGTASASLSAIDMPSSTQTPLPPTDTPTPTPTLAPDTPTAVPSVTATWTATHAPTASSTPTATVRPPSPTPSATATSTRVLPTATPSVTSVRPTSTVTATETPVAPSDTPQPTSTWTMVAPTSTHTVEPPTETPIPPTSTHTSVPPTSTFTVAPPTSTFTVVPPTHTHTPEPPTETPTPRR
ncbi:MAG: protein kinase [Chloroflexi bacterium]|nr:protein kinase [Chloroflexota bacterium]